jgi:hypothetical protein
MQFAIHHDSWRTGAEAEAIHRLQLNITVTIRVTIGTAVGVALAGANPLPRVRGELTPADRLTGLRKAHLHHVLCGWSLSKVVIKSDDAVYFGT